jgi:hypothetical protein
MARTEIAGVSYLMTMLKDNLDLIHGFINDSKGMKVDGLWMRLIGSLVEVVTAGEHIGVTVSREPR